MPTDSHELQMGEALGTRFRVTAFLGGGSFGEVYRMRDLQLDIDVAVKILRAAERTLPDARESFVAEARKQARLRHVPQVVVIYETGELDYRGGPFPYIVMELLVGGSLRDRISKEQPAPVAEACRFGAEIAVALIAAAEQNLIHRDIKPLNVLLDARGHAKLSDFGLAKVSEHSQGMTSHLAGTMAYMAPEQFRGKDLSPKTDVYALGCTLFHLLTGTPPYSGSMEQMMYAHLVRPTPNVRERRPDVPEELDALLARMMAKGPALRPTSLEIAQALRRLAKALPAAEAPALPPKLPDPKPVAVAPPKAPAAMPTPIVQAMISARESTPPPPAPAKKNQAQIATVAQPKSPAPPPVAAAPVKTPVTTPSPAPRITAPEYQPAPPAQESLAPATQPKPPVPQPVATAPPTVPPATPANRPAAPVSQPPDPPAAQDLFLHDDAPVLLSPLPRNRSATADYGSGPRMESLSVSLNHQRAPRFWGWALAALSMVLLAGMALHVVSSMAKSKPSGSSNPPIAVTELPRNAAAPPASTPAPIAPATPSNNQENAAKPSGAAPKPPTVSFQPSPAPSAATTVTPTPQPAEHPAPTPAPAPEHRQMADYHGQPVQQIRRKLIAQGYKVLLRPEQTSSVMPGRISRTVPLAGAELSAGQIVYLYDAMKPPPEPADNLQSDKVPKTGDINNIAHKPAPVHNLLGDYRGQWADAVTNELRAQGYILSAHEEDSDGVVAGKVMRTDPPAGTSLTPGMHIKLYVAK